MKRSTLVQNLVGLASLCILTMILGIGGSCRETSDDILDYGVYDVSSDCAAAPSATGTILIPGSSSNGAYEIGGLTDFGFPENRFVVEGPSRLSSRGSSRECSALVFKNASSTLLFGCDDLTSNRVLECSIYINKHINPSQEVINEGLWEQGAFYSYFEVSYREDTKYMLYEANFLNEKSGTNLNLTEGSSISANGYTLEFNPSRQELGLPGYLESKTVETYLASHTFDLTLASGQQYSTVLTLNPIAVDSDATATTVSSSADFTITWKGADLANDEVVVVLLSQEIEGVYYVAEAENSATSLHTIVIPASEMAKLQGSYAADLQIRRSATPSLTDVGSKGGDATLIYVASDFPVMITGN